jgi:hypothetical protein
MDGPDRETIPNYQFDCSCSEWSIYTHLRVHLSLGAKFASIYNLNRSIVASPRLWSDVVQANCLDSGGLVEGRADGAELDVGEDNAGVGAVRLKIRRLARGSRASTTGDTRLAGVGSGGVAGVEPEHVDRVVVPERHDEDVAASKRRAHTVEAANGSELVVVAESSLLGLAEAVGDGVAADAGDSGLGVLEHLAVLDIEALDLGQAGARADELGDDGHFLLGVEGGAGAVEVLDAHTVAVEVAAVLVADTLVAVVAITTVGACAGNNTRALAGMGGVGSRDTVGLPNIHLRAAGANGTSTGVSIVGVGDPAGAVGLAVDELHVVGALGIAVS